MRHLSFYILFLAIFLSSNLKGQHESLFSADSLFNLGNSSYSNNQFDEAIYFYEKAKLLDPNAKDISTNLQLANERLSTDIVEIAPFFLAKWWNSVSNLMSPGGWKIFSLFALISMLLLVYFHYFKGKPSEKHVFYSLLAGIAFLFVISILAGHSRSSKIFNSPYAIVFGGNQSMYLGPDDVSEEVKAITGGNKVKILDEDDEWYKVATMDSEQGWIKKENVRFIRFIEENS